MRIRVYSLRTSTTFTTYWAYPVNVVQLVLQIKKKIIFYNMRFAMF